ncbi:DUF4082 domain-containing protein [Nocardioides insulae]|uniref:DUF4082 domain-containing protein n=1 Tax=Nocardioides insulae TaxID=394734 RepID=UPI00049216F6|nr:DUF4082 domain-containing protein [Nocardioides insulae]
MTSRSPFSRPAAALVALLVLWAGLSLVTPSAATAAGDPCGPEGNAIACENSRPGSPPSEWEIDGAGDEDIQGFATDISVDVGDRIDFKIDTAASAYDITIYRMGWYGGDGAREIDTVEPSAALPQIQPNCLWDVTTELTDCGNWGVSASWDVPEDAVSGVYIARLHRPSNDSESHITFIVRDEASHSEVLFQTSDPTWQAYNTYGGSDFYQGAGNGRSYKVSYNRPVMTRDGIGGRDFFMSNEYPLVRFLERNGYDVSYLSGVDTDRHGDLLTNHDVFLSVGHDEYWSGAQRENVEAARDAGVNLQFLSGNEVYWRTRYEPSADAGRTPYRTLVSYKETWGNAKIDPEDGWTGTWRDPRFASRADGGGIPENALTGTIFMSNYTDLPVTVSKAEGKLRLWRDTGLASMTAGSTALAPHTVGYESDEDQDNGFRPPGLIDLATTTGEVEQYLYDFGNNTGPETTTHNLTLYRAESGALVFGAGTVQWTWGLDSYHDSPFEAEPADARMQQAQVNLLADMGARPATLMAGLKAATASTDTVGPTVEITSPAAGSAQKNGARVSVTGTATDTGGVVAGVEYSTDGGSSWHPADGAAAWSFSYTQHGVGSTQLRVRAVDDSANIGAASTRSFAVSCPCSIFGQATPSVRPTSTTPVGTLAAEDGEPVELGLRFTPSVDGFVNGVRFYQGAGNTGSHTGTLWSAAGAKLATATFSEASGTGWREVVFDASVAISAGSTYVVSYSAPNGHYTAAPDAFSASSVEAHPLRVAGGYGATAAGVHGTLGRFPTSSYGNTSYAVDVLFSTTDTSALVVTGRWPSAGSASVSRDTAITATFSRPTATRSVRVADQNGDPVAGWTSYDAATRTVTFSPGVPLAGFVEYDVEISATDTEGNPVTTGRAWSFRTAAPAGEEGVCPCTLFSEETTPAVPTVADPGQVTLGVRFTPTEDGTVTGVRFYKGPTNSGTHTGTLWSASGARLAEGTFANEPSSGWTALTFAEPVPVTAGTMYLASYRTEVGNYSVTANDFATADRSRGPLQVTSSAGAYTYGAGFPSSTTATNYLVDVVFKAVDPTLALLARTPADGAADIPRGIPVKLTFSARIADGYRVTLRSGTETIAGTTSLDPTRRVLTFTPGALLPADSEVTATLSGVVSTEGVALEDQQWTFHTRAPDSASAQSLFADLVPAVSATNESAAVELGTAFMPTRNGRITGVRFFKGAGNDGTHVGHLWTADGDLLASATFTAETDTGWQTATVSPAVPVTAGTTYVASYLAPQGHYAATGGFFGTAFSSGDLQAPARNNGRYLYGAAGGFPVYDYGATNYFVDVLFERDPATIALAGVSPQDGAGGVLLDATPSLRVTEPLASGWSFGLSIDGTRVPGEATLSADGRRLSFDPDAPLPAGATVTARVDGIASVEGAALGGPVTWSFSTDADEAVTLLGSSEPAIDAVSDPDAVELGMAFRTSVAGSVTGIRFYKGSGNTGQHVGSLWSADGTRLAQVAFTAEASSGWQEATLDQPVALVPGETYLVSYLAPNGHYSATGGYFGSARTTAPLTAPGGNNGRYRYGQAGGFPNGSWNSTNYFVDVLFRPQG